jgi:hypothetical protein
VVNQSMINDKMVKAKCSIIYSTLQFCIHKKM